MNLVRAALLLVFASTCGFSQVIQAFGSASSATCALPYSVTSGNLVIASSNWESSTSTPSVSDTLGTTFTSVVSNTGGSVKIAIYIGTAASSGADTVTFSVSGAGFQNTRCAELSSVYSTATVDATNSATFSGSPATVSSTVTSTQNGDLLIGSIGGFRSAAAFNAGSAFYLIAGSNGSDSGALEYGLAGTNGSQTISFGDSGNDQGAIAVVALKPPSGISVTSAATAPDGVSGTAYSYALAAVGGAGAYTWSISAGSLQSGLSLSSAGVISGTPTATGSRTVTVQVTDGTNTATKSITLGVGTSFSIPVVVQSAIGNGGIATFQAFGSSVGSGNLLIAACSAPSVTNAVSRPSDTLGTPWVFANAWTNIAAGSQPWSTLLVFYGIAPSSGSDTITCGNSADNSLFASEISGVNSIPDFNTLTTGSGGATITSSSLTPSVANEAAWSSALGFSASTTLTIQTPFTSAGATLSGGGAGYDIISSTSALTPSYSMALNTNGQWTIHAIGFRAVATSIPAGAAFVPQVGAFAVGP